MARKPNYQFERLERDRQKASKVAAKAEEKRQRRESEAFDAGSQAAPADSDGGKS
jgi:hypothetical protein